MTSPRDLTPQEHHLNVLRAQLAVLLSLVLCPRPHDASWAEQFEEQKAATRALLEAANDD